METLAFDPGVTTGVAVLAPTGDVLSTYALRSREDVKGMAIRLNDRHQGAAVVIEQGPLQGGNYRPLIQGIEEDLREIFPDAAWVGPGEWKGHPSARPTHVMRGLTQHEKDAVGLGRFHQAKRRISSARNTT